jgi:hypothetical protein
VAVFGANSKSTFGVDDDPRTLRHRKFRGAENRMKRLYSYVKVPTNQRRVLVVYKEAAERRAARLVGGPGARANG